jgi:hypothetical protein
MADEITTTPTTGAIPQFDFDNALNSPIPENNYDPRPKAIDVYNKVVGNPLTGSNPGANYTPSSDVTKFIKDSNSYKDILFSSSEITGPADPVKNMKPFTYNGDYDGVNFERYYNSKPFKELGFNPYRDNESLYNNRMTIGDEFIRAASQWPSLVSTGFMSGVRSWSTVFTDPLAPDVKGAIEMQRAMAIGSSTKPGVSSFLVNTALNSGYTIGIGVEMLAETLAIAGATALTGGLDAEITLPLWMTRMTGAAAKATKGAEIIGELGKAKSISSLKSFWDNTRTGQILAKAGSVLNPLENTWEVGKDIASGANALKYADQATGTINQFARWSKNFGEFAKDMVMIKAAVSEAKLEGGMIQIDVTKDLINKYKEENNGNEPVGEDLAIIENLAKEESYRTAFWNLPAIMWSNKFMYETLFAPFEKTAKKGIENLATDILFKEGKGFTAVAEGVTGKLQKIKAGITSPKQWGKFGYNYLKENSAEGIQENIQEAISAGAKEHALAKYNNPDRGAYEGYMGHFLKGAKQQFSAQGAETFAGGFVMGAMAHPFMAAPMWAGETVWNNTVRKNKYQEYQAQRKEQLEENVKTLNEFYKDTGKYFAPDMVNALVQGELQKDFYNANLNNDRKKAEDVKSVSQFEHLYTALSTGKFDILMDKFKTFKEFSPEKAAEAFNVKDGSQALKMLDNVVARGEQLKAYYEDVSSSYPNPYDPFRYKKETEEHFAQQNAYSAWEEGKKNLIFAKTEFENHNKRIQELTDTLISKRNPIKNANAQDILTLMDKGQMAITIASLNLDIKTYDNNTPEGKKTIAEKTKRINLLTKLENSFDALVIPTLGAGIAEKTNISNELKKTFKDYINHIAGTSGDIVFDEQLEHALELIKDNYTLRDERASLVKSINVLSNPRGFLNLHRNLAAIYADIENTKEEIIKKNLTQFANNKQLNNAINDLFKTAGVILTPSYSEDLKKAIDNDEVIELPTEYIDATSQNLNIITDVTNPKFIKAQTEWTRISKAIQAEEPKTPVKPVVKTPAEVKGKLIYATKGSGKSTYVKENPQDFVDADQLIVAEIKKYIKANPEIGDVPVDESPQTTIFNFTKNVSKKDKDNLYETVRGQINDLLIQGKNVLTGSTSFIKDADLVYLQQDNEKIGLEPIEIISLREKEQAALEASGKTGDKLTGYIGTKLNIPTPQTREEIEKEKNKKLNDIRVDILKLPANSAFYFDGKKYTIVTKGTTLDDTIVGAIPFGDDEPATFLKNEYTSSKNPASIFNEYKEKIAALDAQEKEKQTEIIPEIKVVDSTIYDTLKIFNDYIDNIIQERIDKFGLKPTDLFSGYTDSIDITTSRAMSGIPIDIIALNEAIDYYYKVYYEITRLKKPFAKQERINKSLTISYLSEIQNELELTLNYLIDYENAIKSGDTLPTFEYKTESTAFAITSDTEKETSPRTITEDTEINNILEEKITKVKNKPISKKEIKTGKYPSINLIKKGIKLGFTKEQIVDMSSEDRDMIKVATSVEDVKELLSRFNVPIETEKVIETTKIPEIIPTDVKESEIKTEEIGDAEYTSMSDKIRVPGKGIIKGTMVTFPTLETPNTFFVYQDKKKDGGLFNIMSPTGEVSIETSDISEEDVIQKGFNLLQKDIIQFEKVDIGVQLNKIKDIKTFEEFDQIFDIVKQDTNNESIEIDLIINKAFDKKEAELFYVKTRKNLLSAQKKGYKIKIGDGIYTNFTVNPKTVSVLSAMGTISTDYPFSEIDFITKMAAKEPTPVTPEMKADIKTAVEGSTEILSSSALLDANNEAKTKTIDQALNELDDSIGCE